MRIKKFRCIQCGGPKINRYTTPYVVCDFCGSLTDIDFTVGMEKWYESAPATLNYQVQKMWIMTQAQAALAAGDQRAYFALQKQFWDVYYRSFPTYLPPSIDSDLKYAIYLGYAHYRHKNAFEPKWQQYGAQQQMLQSKLQYINVGETNEGRVIEFFPTRRVLRIDNEGRNAGLLP